MGESPEALRQTIAATHEDLNRNLEALEAKGQDLTDWRSHFEKRPLMMLGVAFVGGAIAAAVVGGGRSSRQHASDPVGETVPFRPSPRRASNDTWDRLRSGIGVAAAGIAIDAISKAMPGIKEHVIDPVRASIRPEEKPVSTDRRFSGMGTSKVQGNGYQT
jgi:hypothetical protein